MLGNGFLPMFSMAGGAAAMLTGATWALDGSGRAYNTPTLSGELLTNGDFSSWSGDNPTGWSLNSAENATNFVTEVAGQARIVADSFWGIRQFVTSVGIWYQFGLNVNTIVSNNIRIDSGGIAVTSYTTTGTKLGTSRFPGTYLGIYRGASGSCDFTVDNATIKAISLPTTLATVTGSANNLIAAGKIHTLVSGTQAGVGALLDSASNPQNGLWAYHDGTGVTLDKCVNGTWTNLVPRVTVAFSSLAQAEIRPLGSNQFDLYYGGVKRGTTATVADASIVNNTIYGLFSTYSGNLFTEFSLGGAVIPFGF